MNYFIGPLDFVKCCGKPTFHYKIICGKGPSQDGNYVELETEFPPLSNWRYPPEFGIWELFERDSFLLINKKKGHVVNFGL